METVDADADVATAVSRAIRAPAIRATRHLNLEVDLFVIRSSVHIDTDRRRPPAT
jgi:hypothetical protein